MSRICRLCQGADTLEALYTFGEQPVAGYLEDTREQALAAPRFELSVALCTACAHVQQAHDLARPLLIERVYPAYKRTFSSGRVASYIDRFLDRAIQAAGLGPGDQVLEVGSNDGQLLRRLRDRGLRAVGFEPATDLALATRAEGLDVIVDYFDGATAAAFANDHPAVGLLVTRHTLEHAFEPIDFLRAISTVLRPEGLAVVEVPYLRLQMLRGHFEAMTFQHVSFFSALSLQRAFADANLQIVDLCFVDVDGGSVVVYARKGGSGDASLEDRVRNCMHVEELAQMHLPSGYAKFFEHVSGVRRMARAHLQHLAACGRRVLACGAGGKGQALLNMLGLDSGQIQAVIDDAPGVVGRYVPGTDIPVVSGTDPAAERCDAILLTAPTHIESVVDRESRRGRGGVPFLATVPAFHYVVAPWA